MFSACEKLTSADPIKDWNTESVEKMNYMFVNCSSLKSADLKAWDLPNINAMESMFNGTPVKNPFEDVFPMACPREGSFEGWCRGSAEITVERRRENVTVEKRRESINVLVKLNIPEKAKRSSTFGKRCRANMAVPIGIYDMEGNELLGVTKARTDMGYAGYISFEIGKTVLMNDFNTDRFEPNGKGIRFYMDFDDAAKAD